MRLHQCKIFYTFYCLSDYFIYSGDLTIINFASSVEELVAQTVEKTIEEITTDRLVANNNKNRQIVVSLFEKGIFDIKDAISLVADRLDISRHTVYLYIRQIKQEQD